MRTFRLARIAAEAEGLRLRTQARRTVVRLALALIGAAFLITALGFGHAAVWFALRWYAGMAPWATALVVGGIDLVIALALVLIAAMSGPGRVETEARMVRQRALENAAGSIAIGTLLVPALRMGIGMLRK
jgi:hypothetical protein